jgi:hypothetical protein
MFPIGAPLTRYRNMLGKKNLYRDTGDTRQHHVKRRHRVLLRYRQLYALRIVHRTLLRVARRYSHEACCGDPTHHGHA